jgi:hypothetical protein
MPYTTPFPNFKVAEHIHSNANGCAPSVKEDEVREGGEGEGPFGAEEDEHGHNEMAEAPI